MSNKFLFESDRLALREIEENDIEYLKLLHCDKEVMQYIGNGKFDWSTTEFINELNRHIKNYDKGYGFWTTIEKSSRKICGKCGIIENSKKNGIVELEIGYLFGKDYWRRNYATEVVGAIVKYAFNILNINELVAYTFKNNLASIRVLEKNNMIKISEFQVKDHAILKFSINKQNF